MKFFDFKISLESQRNSQRNKWLSKPMEHLTSGAQEIEIGKRALRQLFQKILDVQKHHSHAEEFSNKLLEKIQDDLNSTLQKF